MFKFYTKCFSPLTGRFKNVLYPSCRNSKMFRTLYPEQNNFVKMFRTPSPLRPGCTSPYVRKILKCSKFLWYILYHNSRTVRFTEKLICQKMRKISWGSFWDPTWWVYDQYFSIRFFGEKAESKFWNSHFHHFLLNRYAGIFENYCYLIGRKSISLTRII